MQASSNPNPTFVYIYIIAVAPSRNRWTKWCNLFSKKTRTYKKKGTGCAPDAFSFAFHHDGMKGVAVAMAEADNVCVRDEGHSQRETIRVPPSLYPLRPLSVHPLKPFVHPSRWLRGTWYLGPVIIRVWTRYQKPIDCPLLIPATCAISNKMLSLITF